MIAPVFEELSRQYASTVDFLKVDVDEASDVARAYSVSSMPTFHGYHNGTKVFEFAGADRDLLRANVERHAPKTAAFGGTGQKLGGSDGANGPGKINWGRYEKKVEKNADVAGETAAGAASGSNDPSKTEAKNPAASSSSNPSNDPRLKVNPVMFKQLEDMGFPKVRAEKSLILTGNKSVEAAMEWVFAHSDDGDIDEPLQLVTSEGEEKSQLSPEERKKVADELLAKARAKRVAKEKADAIEREKNRIRSGKEATLAKANLETAERKRKVELRRKEKAEARAQRERVREQLKADKEARIAKFNYTGIAAEKATKPVAPPVIPEVKPPAPVSAGKIQLRLPDGKRLEKTFEPGQTVGDVADFVAKERPDISAKGFDLAQQYPRRKYTSQDYSLTLESVDLLPRGALVVQYQ